MQFCSHFSVTAMAGLGFSSVSHHKFQFDPSCLAGETFSHCSDRIQVTKKLLGKGGFATVYEGWYDKRQAAIKRILNEDVNPREGDFMTRCRHHNVLELLYSKKDQQFT